MGHRHAMQTVEPPRIDVTLTSTDDVDLVTVRGELDLTTVGELRAVTLDPIRCTRPVLAVDLNGCTLLDSQGIATLVATRRRTTARAAELVLVCADPHLLKLLRISQLDTVLRVVPTVAEVQLPYGGDDTGDGDVA